MRNRVTHLQAEFWSIPTWAAAGLLAVSGLAFAAFASVLAGQAIVAPGAGVGGDETSGAAGATVDDGLPAQAKQNWHQWRGPHGDGSAMASSPPVQWSQTENIRWKVAVPGKGSSSPIIWEDKIYLMTAIELANTAEATGADDQVASSGLVADPQNLRTDANRGGEPRRRGRATPPNNASAEVTLGVAGGQERQDQERQEQGGRGERGERGGRQGRGRGREPQVVNPHQFVVLCLERSTGKELWRKVVCEAVPHEAGHGTNTFSAASPIVDGQRIYANFGSRGFYCLDMQGEVLWQKELGQMSTRNGFGEGSSASVYGQTVVIPWDHEGDSFIVALDAQSGREKWRAERAERTTWATPLITPFGNRVQVVTNGNRVRSYDLETGDLLWECGGQVGNPVPTPVRFEDQVVCMTGYQGYAIASMALDSQGDITGTDKVAWTGGGAAPYVPSPVLYDGLLYFVKSNNPVVVVRDVKTGDVIVDETRLPKMRVIYASPVAADGKIYFCSREGVTVVLKHGPTAEVLAVNELGETIDASPAIVGSELYIRGESHLYCIAAD